MTGEIWIQRYRMTKHMMSVLIRFVALTQYAVPTLHEQL